MAQVHKRGWFYRVVREPLVHFLLGGLLVFLFFALRGADGGEGRDIVVSPQLRSSLVEQLKRTQGRDPTPDERKSFIEQWVREEILYREALRRRFDRDDLVIRRRLANKMEFFLEATSAEPQPSRADLERWFEDNSGRYRVGGRIDFMQLWFPSEGEARDALGDLKKGADWNGLSGKISLPNRLENQSREQVLKRFGDRFSRALSSVRADGWWHGPIPSSFGYHLVNVSKRSPGRVPPLDAIQEDVAEDWRRAERDRQLQRAYVAYRDRYKVTMPK